MNRLFLVLFALCFLDTLILVALEIATECENDKRPHIIIFMADDMGWNDVSFHGSDQIPTPNIDALAYNGVILNQHYSQALCTPSRAAFMTGKYPIHLGMQHDVIFPSEPRGLPLEEILMPQYLKNMNYVTHALGKWHLGSCKSEYTPTRRGFDTHVGYWNGFQNYYNHKVTEPKTNYAGMDMRRDMSAAWDTVGNYSTDLYTQEAVDIIDAHDPDKPLFLYLAHLAPHAGDANGLLQAPQEEIDKFSYIKNQNRRNYTAIVSVLDKSLGDVVTALKNRNMLQNSIIVFLSDNGAPTNGFMANSGSNYPLRGIKDSPFEGGIRTPAAIWSPLIKQSKRVCDKMIHITDWLPTLLCAAGVTNISNIDGVNMWPMITHDKGNPRSQMVINIDNKWTISNQNRYSAIRIGDYKLVQGSTEANTEWIGDSGRNSTEEQPPYKSDNVLNSTVGIAIASLTTNKLTSEEILDLRQQAEVRCNVTEAEKRKCDLSMSTWCLFNLKRDPCEMINIYQEDCFKARELKKALDNQTVKPANNELTDPCANPRLWNNTWASWKDSDLHAEKNICSLLNIFTHSYK